jgi:hypothetical protein
MGEQDDGRFIFNLAQGCVKIVARRVPRARWPPAKSPSKKTMSGLRSFVKLAMPRTRLAGIRHPRLAGMKICEHCGFES